MIDPKSIEIDSNPICNVIRSLSDVGKKIENHIYGLKTVKYLETSELKKEVWRLLEESIQIGDRDDDKKAYWIEIIYVSTCALVQL